MPKLSKGQVQVNIIMPVKDRDRLKALAASNRRSLSAHILYMLDGALRQDDEADANANRLGKERMRVA